MEPIITLFVGLIWSLDSVQQWLSVIGDMMQGINALLTLLDALGF